MSEAERILNMKARFNSMLNEDVDTGYVTVGYVVANLLIGKYGSLDVKDPKILDEINNIVSSICEICVIDRVKLKSDIITMVCALKPKSMLELTYVENFNSISEPFVKNINQNKSLYTIVNDLIYFIKNGFIPCLSTNDLNNRIVSEGD